MSGKSMEHHPFHLVSIPHAKLSAVIDPPLQSLCVSLPKSILRDAKVATVHTLRMRFSQLDCLPSGLLTQ